MGPLHHDPPESPSCLLPLHAAPLSAGAAGQAHRRHNDALLPLLTPPLHQQSIQQDVPIAGMMTGISEMTLPLEQRLKRIEETEIAKRGMLAAASKRYGAWYGVGILTFL